MHCSLPQGVEVFEEKLNALCMQWLIDNGRLRSGGWSSMGSVLCEWGVCCVGVQHRRVAGQEDPVWGSGKVGGSGLEEWQGGRVWHGEEAG